MNNGTNNKVELSIIITYYTLVGLSLVLFGGLIGIIILLGIYDADMITMNLTIVSIIVLFMLAFGALHFVIASELNNETKKGWKLAIGINIIMAVLGLAVLVLFSLAQSYITFG